MRDRAVAKGRGPLREDHLTQRFPVAHNPRERDRETERETNALRLLGIDEKLKKGE